MGPFFGLLVSLSQAQETITFESPDGLELSAFITASKFEADDWQAIFGAIPSENKVGFIPEEGFGQHGSASPKESVPDSELYWQAHGDL